MLKSIPVWGWFAQSRTSQCHRHVKSNDSEAHWESLIPCTFADFYTCSCWRFLSISTGTWQGFVKLWDPETFNLPTEAPIKVCKRCNKSASSLRSPARGSSYAPFQYNPAASPPHILYHTCTFPDFLRSSLQMKPAWYTGLHHLFHFLQVALTFNYIGGRKTLCCWYHVGWLIYSVQFQQDPLSI